jgi:hypothetical protein
MIRQFKITAKHDNGIFSMVIYGHSSEESAIKAFLDVEKAPRSCILKVEDLSTVERTTSQILRVI